LRWRFPGLHVDATPAIAGDRLFSGSGYGKAQMFCLDIRTGKALWQTPSDHSVFGSPTVQGDRVFFGIGNGKVNRSLPNPGGVVVCLDVETGKRLWRFDVEDAVLSAPAVEGDHVYFGSRDGVCYCVDVRGGQLVWMSDLMCPLVASPVLADNRLIVVATDGNVHLLSRSDGRPLWQFDIGKHTRTTPEVVSRPALARAADGSAARLYIGAGLHYSINSAAVVLCLRIAP
jgi:outer membrane protein assembly factor BamB